MEVAYRRVGIEIVICIVCGNSFEPFKTKFFPYATNIDVKWVVQCSSCYAKRNGTSEVFKEMVKLMSKETKVELEMLINKQQVLD